MPKYRIEYSPETEDYLRYLSKRQQVMVLGAVEKQLEFQPDIETRNRKPMRPNPLAPWERRIGTLRVYYDFEDSLKELFLSVRLESKKGIMLESERR